MLNKLISVYYAIKSRLKPITISQEDIIYWIRNLNWQYQQGINFPPFFNLVEQEHLIQRFQKLNSALNYFSIIFFYPIPYAFYYQPLKRYAAGIGINKIYNFTNFIAVAKYSLWKSEIYPYFEHEVLHAYGLLKYDHSNWNDYKHLAKYL
jgi:hypothetical protein